MKARHLWSVACTLAVLLHAQVPAALADGVCTERPATAAEKKMYGDAYALFLRVAPKAPDGWTATDQPDNGTLPTLCREFDNAPIRRSFSRSFELLRGRKERDEKAQQAYTTMAEQQRAKAAANQAAADAIDAKVSALTVKVQAAATAQKFDQIEPLNRQIDALLQQKMALVGVDELQAQSDRIDAEATRDTRASFALYFEAAKNEPADGARYRTAAGRGQLSTYDAKGNPIHLVFIEFGGSPQQAVVRVEGDPARVRTLVDGSDLKAVAAFR